MMERKKSLARGSELEEFAHSVPKHAPTMRLHLWLETEEGLFFGIGRAQLLAKIQEYGSLKKAADELGMSYRAAWGKIRKTEKVLGLELVERTGDRREGYHLTEFGKEIQRKFNFWFNTIEKQAMVLAQELFPWPIEAFGEKSDD